MPYLKNDFGWQEYFDYDPKVIAKHLYEGKEVYPDDGLSEEEFNSHNLEINDHLRNLWGDQTMRTIPGRGTLPPWKNEIPELYRPPVRGGADFMDVKPNPGTEFKMRRYEPPSNYPQVVSGSIFGSQGSGSVNSPFAPNTLRGANRLRKDRIA